MRQILAATLVCLALPAQGCLGQSRPARMQEAASDFNVNTRFGRTELSVERVAESYRASFVERHRAWGGDIRIADAEMSSAKLVGETGAEVTVRFGWWRADEGDLRTTAIRQKWLDQKGNWLLVSEERIDGEPGLFGEKRVTPAPATPQANAKKKPAQFATIRIGEQPPQPDGEIDDSAAPTIPLPATP